MVALIPARAGSQRCPGKNMRLLQGAPLLAYTIAAAQQSGVFERICVCTDSQTTADYAEIWGVDSRVAGPPCHTDDCCDITWVRDFFAMTLSQADAFAILRPTSPFRTAATIQRARAQFERSMDSLRAVEWWDGPHPGKMWIVDPVRCRLSPIMPDRTTQAPYHSSPTQTLDRVLRQNSSLEMAWTRVLDHDGTISGTDIQPFFTIGLEGFAIDTEADWTEAERLADAHPELFPRLEVRI